MPHSELIDDQMQHLNLADAAQAETPESVRFHSLPQAMQRRLLLDYPRILATAMHQYSQGDDCESVLLRTFESSSEILRARNSNGDNPLAVAMLSDQSARAERLMELAARRNPAALDDRSRFQETLLMLSTSSSSAAGLMEQLLIREPTQLHRLYDNDGRNFLHHCALESSTDALEAALRITRQLMQENRLDAAHVSAAVHMNDRSGDTAMHMMAGRNRLDMLSQLVQFARDAGIDINLDERQHRGNRWTPMMSAVDAGAADVVEFLLANGADPTEEDSNGHTVIDMAAGNDRLMGLFTVMKVEQMEVAADETVISPVKLEVTGCAPAEVAPWLQTKVQSVGSVDSGVCSLVSVPSVASGGPNCQHSCDNLATLDAQLMQCGKSLAFLEALVKRNPRLKIDAIVQMSDRPVTTAFGLWASYHEQVPRDFVLEALKEVSQN